MYVSFYELNLELQAKHAEYASRILLYMCPHTAICARIRGVREPPTAVYVSGYIVSGERRGVRESRILLYCVRILLYMCPHTAICVSAYCYVCVRTLLCMCPHTAMYVSAYCHICVSILLWMCPHAAAIYVSADCYVRARHA